MQDKSYCGSHVDTDGHLNMLTYVTCAICKPLSNSQAYLPSDM